MHVWAKKEGKRKRVRGVYPHTLVHFMKKEKNEAICELVEK
jgi:hypothetical protein